jgi:hypothetical protein
MWFLFPALWFRDRLLGFLSDYLWSVLKTWLTGVARRYSPVVILWKARHQELLDAEEALRAIDTARQEARERASCAGRKAG